MGSKKTKSSGQMQQQTTVNPWSQQQFQQGSQGILDAIGNYNTQNPFKPYTGEMVAGLSPDQMRARELARTSAGYGPSSVSGGKGGDQMEVNYMQPEGAPGAPGAGGGQSSWAGILGEADAAARAGAGFDAADVSRFYNPYEREVVDATGAYFDENLARQLSENQSRASQSGAYGGSRHGVADAELMRTSGMDRAKLMADLRYQGHQGAVDTGFRQQQGQYQGAGILGSLAGQRQGMTQNDVSMFEQLGANEREIEQARLLASRAEFDRAAADQLQRLMIELQSRQGILGATPITTNTSGTQSGTGKQSGFSMGWNSKDGLSFGF